MASKERGAPPARGTGGRQAWSQGAVGSLRWEGKCHYQVMSWVFAGEYGQPEKPGIKVLETCMKTS